MKLNFLVVIVVLLIALSTSEINAQKRGSLATPYSTLGWDAPVDYSTYYKLFIYRLLSNPGGWINIQTVRIDSLFNALIVLTDTTQLVIQNDTLRFSPHMSGKEQFSGTATTDTLLIPGLKSTDVVVVSAAEAPPSSKDVLAVQILTGKIVVFRPSDGTNNLRWNWIWIRKY